MNEQTLSAIRTVLKVLGAMPIGVIIFHWLGIDPDTLVAIIGAGSVFVGLVWSALANRKKAIVAKAADIVPVPVASQKAVGIVDVTVLPTNPPKPSAKVS